MTDNSPTREELGLDDLGGLSDPLFTPAEVARMFRVDPKTVTRWSRAGKLPCVWTIGGHRRFRRSDIEAVMRIDEAR
jgi:excisionase family DNA binding protein